LTKKLSVPVDLSDAKRKNASSLSVGQAVFFSIWVVALVLAGSMAIAVGIKG
jgi:hypothetical protein